MGMTQEQTGTFEAAMKAFNKIHVKRTADEIGEYLGIPKDYNKPTKETEDEVSDT
jgi:hypothetical protein